MAKFPDEHASGRLKLASDENAETLNEPAAQNIERNTLEIAKADGEYLVRTNELRRALAGEVDPDGLQDKYEPLFRQAYDSSASLISDPQQRDLWTQGRAVDLKGHVLAASDRAFGLTREGEIMRAGAQLDTIRDSALQTADQGRRAEFIEAANGLIAGLQQAGYIGEADAKERQKTWAKDFALAAFLKLPAAEQVKGLEGNPQDRDAGRGELIDFVPEAKRESLLQAAWLDLRNEERVTQSLAALAKYQTERGIRDDLSSILKTGKSADDIAPDDVQATLGPDIAARWREAREDYRLIHNHSHDLYALTESGIEARLRALKPVDEGAEPRKAAVFRAVQERADDLRHMRLIDPARSVADDPLVRAAAERAQSGDPRAVRELHTARLAAQERAGIDPSAQSPIAKDEALSLIAPLRDAKIGEERDVLRRLGESFRTQFGADATRTLAFALRTMVSDTQEIVAAAQMLESTQLRDGKPEAIDPQMSETSVAPNDPAAEGAAAASDPQSGSAGAAGEVSGVSQPLILANDPLFGWHTIGQRAQDGDGFDIAFAGLAAASGGGRRPPRKRGEDGGEPTPPRLPWLDFLFPGRHKSKPDSSSPGSPAAERDNSGVINGPEAIDLEEKIAATASPEHIKAHPLMRDVVRRMDAIAETATEDQITDVGFTNARVFESKDERIVGYDAMDARLEEIGRANSTDGPVRNEGVATIVIGLPASGKSEIAKYIARKHFAAIVDIDDARPFIPEYQGGVGGWAVHRESAELARRVLARLTADRTNVVIPKIGSDATQIEEQIQDLIARGYQVNLLHVDVPWEEAFRRNASRYLKTGRLVPFKFIENRSLDIRETYDILTKKGIPHDKAQIYNGGPPGTARVTDGDGEFAYLLRQRKD